MRWATAAAVCRARGRPGRNSGVGQRLRRSEGFRAGAVAARRMSGRNRLTKCDYVTGRPRATGKSRRGGGPRRGRRVSRDGGAGGSASRVVRAPCSVLAMRGVSRKSAMLPLQDHGARISTLDEQQTAHISPETPWTSPRCSLEAVSRVRVGTRANRRPETVWRRASETAKSATEGAVSKNPKADREALPSGWLRRRLLVRLFAVIVPACAFVHFSDSGSRRCLWSSWHGSGRARK